MKSEHARISWSEIAGFFFPGLSPAAVYLWVACAISLIGANYKIGKKMYPIFEIWKKKSLLKFFCTEGWKLG